jgi:hypothetical protein
MIGNHWPDSAQVAELLRQCLDDGSAVEIDGLGVFRIAPGGGFEFLPEVRPRVFLAYAVEDRELVERLYDDLAARGFDPWMDRRKLLPGQNWPECIRRTIDVAHYFIACLSERSVRKRGQFQTELRQALAVADSMPLDDVYFLPVRLDRCRVPVEISKRFQYVDLSPDWESGLDRIVQSMRPGLKAA